MGCDDQIIIDNSQNPNGQGRTLHREYPYDDPRVRVDIDDGREFLRNTRETYELIIFALPD